MAVDTGFFKYIEAAFRYRIFDPKGMTATPDTLFSYRGYNLPFKRIFTYARRLLPKFYVNEFPNTPEGDLLMARQVLERLDRRQDMELTKAFNPTIIPTAIAPVIEEATAESATHPAPAGAQPISGGPAITSPNAPSFRPPVIHNIPQNAPTPQTQPEIIIANKSGVVTEAPTTKPELVIAGKSGVAEQTPTGEKLIITDRSGKPKEAPPKEIFIANKSGIVTGVQNIKPPSWLRTLGSNAQIYARKGIDKTAGGLMSMIKGIGSSLAGGASAGLGAAAPALGRAGRGLAGGLQRIPQPGGIGGNRAPVGGGGGTRGGGGFPGLSVSSTEKKVGLALLLGIFFFMLFSSFTNFSGTTPVGETSPIATPAPGTGTGSNISSCKFTRSGSSTGVKSSILQGWISAAAAAAGIPASALASVAMHESQDFVANADNNHNAIKTNQYCIKGLIFCEDGHGHVLHSLDNKDDPCTPAEIASGDRTAQAVGLMQNLDIYNVGKDLCSITENLNIAAAKLKFDGLTAQPTKDQVTSAVNSYYNGCDYGSGYSYCTEVWQDIQNCQASSQPVTPPNPGIATDCPITGGSAQVTCGSKNTPLADYRTGTLCGHCGVNYPPDSFSAYCGIYPGTQYSLDIAGNDLQDIYLPKINGNTVSWTFIDGNEGGPTQRIQKYIGTVSSGGSTQSYYLQLHHTEPDSGNPNAKQSGDVGGKICGSCNPPERHVHIQIGSGGRDQSNTAWLDAAQYFCKK